MWRLPNTIVYADPFTEGSAMAQYMRGNLYKREVCTLIENIIKIRCKPFNKVKQ